MHRLELCTSSEYVDVVKVLLAHGADPNARNASGLPPLAEAVAFDKREDRPATHDQPIDPVDRIGHVHSTVLWTVKLRESRRNLLVGAGPGPLRCSD